MVCKARYFISFSLPLFWLLSMSLADPGVTWGDCEQESYGYYGDVSIDINCNNSTIEVTLSTSDELFYYRLLEYVCYLPKSNTTISDGIEAPATNVLSNYVVTTNSPLPGGTKCIVRGCYFETNTGFVTLFNNSASGGSCTTEHDQLTPPISTTTLTLPIPTNTLTPPIPTNTLTSPIPMTTLTPPIPTTTLPTSSTTTTLTTTHSVGTTEGISERTRHLALGLTLPLLSAVLFIVVVFIPCIMWRRRKHHRTNFQHYKFDVESKVDLTYDPGVIRVDASFAFHGSVGSVLHELNLEREIPLTTYTYLDGEDVNTVIPKGGQRDVSMSSSENETNVIEERTSVTNEDDNSSGFSQLRGEKDSNHENDSYSSGGSQMISLRQTQTSSAVTNSNTSGYVTDTVGCQSNSGISVKTDSDSHSCQQLVPLVDEVISVQSPTPQHLLQETDEEVPVFDFHDENSGEVRSKDTCTSTSKGYIYSDHYPTSSSGLTVCHTLSSNGDTPTEHTMRVSNFTNLTTTNAGTTIHSPPLHTMDTTTLEVQKASSVMSLNVITDLEQAFPLMSQFVSSESLNQTCYPAPSLIHLHTLNKAHSQTNVHCNSVSAAHHTDYPQQEAGVFDTETAESHPFAHRDVTASFTTKTTPEAGRFVNTFHLRSVHTFSGSANTIPASQTETIRENCTPNHLSIPKRDEGEKPTTVSFTKNASGRHTTTKQCSPLTPSYSDYINTEPNMPLLPEQRRVVVIEKCRTPTYPQEVSSGALAECLESAWDISQQEEHQHCLPYTSYAPYYSEKYSGNGVLYSPSHERVSSESCSQKPTSSHLYHKDDFLRGGVSNILFSLDSDSEEETA